MEKTNNTIEPNRLEGLSDGTFAIIITLLVLEIHRPNAAPGKLGAELLKEWPSYLAYAFAFVYVGIVWLNHHYVLKRIRQKDLILNWINLGILGTVALIPFPTGVLASAFRDGTLEDQKAAVVLYAFVGMLMSAAWIPLLIHMRRHPESIISIPSESNILPRPGTPLLGVFLYFLAGLLGWFIHPFAAIGIFVFMLTFYASRNHGGLPPQKNSKYNGDVGKRDNSRI